MTPNIFFALINLGSALLIVAAAIPLVMGKVGMNRVYGVRIRKSFESERNWYAINAYGGRQLIVWSIPLIVAGIGCLFVPIGDQNKDLVAILLGVVPISLCVVGATINTLVFARRL
jgi:hypothetical protein